MNSEIQAERLATGCVICGAAIDPKLIGLRRRCADHAWLRTCNGCGGKYYPDADCLARGGNKGHCSAECRCREAICRECGKPFIYQLIWGGNRRFCSVKCRHRFFGAVAKITRQQLSPAERRALREPYKDREREYGLRYYLEHLDAKREQSRDYRRRNSSYKRQKDRQRKQAQYSIPAPRRSAPWTAAENRIVMRDDLLITEICFMLGRGYNAVTTRRRKLRQQQQ